jgi:hypothetical protein
MTGLLDWTCLESPRRTIADARERLTEFLGRSGCFGFRFLGFFVWTSL